MPTNADTQACLVEGRSGYLVIEGERYLVEVLGVRGGEIWVSFPTAGFPPPGIGAELEFYSETGSIIYHTQVLRGPERPNDGVLLERSETAEQKQHRNSWRVPTDFKVTFYLGDQEESHTAYMENISTGGMQLRMGLNLPLRQELLIGFALSDGYFHRARAKVVYAAEASPLHQLPPMQYGVEFTDIHIGARRSIMMYMYKRIRQLYPEDVMAMYPRSSKRSG
ncbi:MAG: PilZ domain-containing protein [Candidatus Hydrogenedentes bacterium]|nr:PilZ domain-containing protein [Candidatus Hydrogenedentota bacterium]